jgi:hypothetical protein
VQVEDEVVAARCLQAEAQDLECSAGVRPVDPARTVSTERDVGAFHATCYRPRYLNIQRLNYLWTIRHCSARIVGNMITQRDCRRGLGRARTRLIADLGLRRLRSWALAGDRAWS